LRVEAEVKKSKEEALKRAIRKDSCQEVDELLKVILSGKIFSEFKTKAQLSALVSVPDKFESHEDYINAWDPLFFYEL
jgi:hypothetical protein